MTGPIALLSPRRLVVAEPSRRATNPSHNLTGATPLILNFLIKKLGQQLAVKGDIQPLKMVLFVDETHLLLPKEHKAGLLSQLARQGRSWGFPVWMASAGCRQVPDDRHGRNELR